jgi:hypothetical protein
MRPFLIVAGLCLAVPAGAQAPSPLQLCEGTRPMRIQPLPNTPP